MSVRLTSADYSDHLIATLPGSLTLSGDFSIGYWIKGITTLGGVMAVSIAPSAGSFAFLVMGEFPHKAYFAGGSVIGGSGYTLTADTWYWVTVVRSGAGSNNVTYSIYDDSTSTTPLGTVKQVTDTTTFSSVATVVIGDDAAYWNNGCVNAEIEMLKIQTGVAWTNSEARTESQNYGIQKSGGTDRLCWKLTNVDADTDGINEIGGAGPNFTNTGVVAGASAPSQLASVTLEQEGFRWVQDDGSESASTFTAAQDTSITAAAGTTKRLRMLINATGDPATKQYKLQWRLSGGSWADVT